jgi:DNA-directed RNA polymerase subunit RPC12/RpoP
MIRFSCIYCGQEVPAPEDVAGKTTPCPGCGHSIRVRADRPGAALQSSTGRRADAAPRDEHYWEGKTDDEIVQEVLVEARDREEQKKREAKGILSRTLVQYDDLSLFVLSVALMLLLLLNLDARVEVLTASALPRAGGPVAFALIGMVLSFINIFRKREKYESEKQLMLLFAVLVTGGTGVYAGYITWKASAGWLMIFPLWNILNGGVLLLQFYEGYITTDSITDEKPSFRQTVLAAVSVSFLLLLCQYVFRLHWAVTFSIAVCYTMSLLVAIQDLLGTRPHRAAFRRS